MSDLPPDSTKPERPTGIEPVSIIEEMQRSYLDYAMSVIVSRALPDVRDGLKPVHRRVLFAMSEMGLVWNKSYRKSAGVVGEVMGKYHPHGDASIYDALVRMAQDFSLRAPLIDGQGNFGSIDGDPPAAMRYTECRLEKVSDAILADIDKETVDFQDNYDGREQEPVVLPARVPNLLLNGSGGIAVGMATNIPPHNLGELIDGCIALIDNPSLQLPISWRSFRGRTSRRVRSCSAEPGSRAPMPPVAAPSSCAARSTSRICAAIAKPSSSPRFPIR